MEHKNIPFEYVCHMVDENPMTCSQTISSPNALIWREAIKSELESILANHTWELVNLSPATKGIGSKWVFEELKSD